VILAGDVGGTKTLLALVEPIGRSLRVVAEARYESGKHRGLEPIVEAFLRDKRARPKRAVFGVAGPVMGGRAELTNLDWKLDRSLLASAVGLEIALVNDLEATGYGLGELTEEQIEVLQPGQVGSGNQAIVAAGTGLGVAIVAETEGRLRVFASEGGHVDFAPRDDDEVAFLRWLHTRYGRVSAERVVSGPGIADLYRFLVETGRGEPSRQLAASIDAAEDPSIAISEAALAGGAPICEDVMRRFAAAYGAVAGNVALTALALGGVWLSGGIAPEIVPILRAGSFLEAFRDKGRMSELLERVPVKVVLEERVVLLGAARYGMTRAVESL
jgi:glucokinase